MDSTIGILDTCIGCGLCAKVCIRGHLALGNDKKMHETESVLDCFRCGHCAAVCPTSSVVLKWDPSEQRKISERPVTAEQLGMLYSERRSMRWFDRGCTKEEISALLDSVHSAPTAENSQSVEFAVIDDRFGEFMELVASILSSHTHEHPRLKQFVDYVEAGQKERNNPFTWEGRQLIVAFARFPIDAIIAMEQADLMAFAMGLGGFHSRWILQASENDPERFMSFFPQVSDGLMPYAVYIIGHPRVRYRRTVPRDARTVHWM